MKKLLAAAASMLPLVVFAHHGHVNQFDSSKIVEVSGVVTNLRFVNPHSYVEFDVTNAEGEVEAWRCEMRAAYVLKRSGWSEEMFEPGTPISISGIASRKEATGCYIETLALGEQEAIGRYAQLEENKAEIGAERSAKTSWGVPNLAGDWAAEQVRPDTSEIPSYLGHPPGMGPDGPLSAGGPPGAGRPTSTLSESGQAAMARLVANADEGAGNLDCKPRSFVRDWIADQHTNLIEQDEDKITLKYGFMDTVRTVHLDMNEHPKEIEPSFAGHSIGWWQDDVLVVHTTGFDEQLVVAGPRGPVGATSDQYHVTERFSVDNEAGTLTRSYVAKDPVYWVDGHQESGEQTILLADYPWEPYACEDLAIE